LKTGRYHPSNPDSIDACHRVRSIVPPLESRLADSFKGADLVDAFAITIPATATHDINVLADAAFGHPGGWLRVLLAIRDAAVVGFGLKTTRQLRSSARMKSADHIDFFPVHSRSSDELIVGEDDRHLDFRASILLRPLRGGRDFEMVVTTVARCHNLLGRSYLALIMPFHRLVVRSSLRLAAQRASHKEALILAVSSGARRPVGDPVPQHRRSWRR
jgi:hypothetical protein